MSAETLEWLNTQVLVGNTELRKGNDISWLTADGKAWHYDETLQGAESTHYPYAIPVEDVQRRLFNWTAEESELFIFDGADYIAVPDRKAITTSDTHEVLGVFKGGYEPHQYSKWLIDNIAILLGQQVGIASAAQLRNRGQAFVQVEVPENVTTPEGIKFRPNIGAATSFDGTLATTYKKGVSVWVCDNSLAAGLAEDGEVFRTKHTRHSQLLLKNARDALNIITQIADEFAETIAQLAATEVTLAEWAAFLDELVPVPEDPQTRGEKSAQSRAEKKRDELQSLYLHDERVSPWAGTALGVVQATNTWGQHFQTVKNVSRGERNFSNIVNGAIFDDDAATLATLAKVQGRQLLLVR
jgi:phage/plasmid-like protein (TIGR03299 family)